MTAHAADRPVSRTPRAVHFDIGHLTLEGYSSAQRARFVRSLRAQLTELAAGDGLDWLAAAQRPLAHVDAGTLRPGAAPEEAARHIASSLLSRLGPQAGSHV